MLGNIMEILQVWERDHAVDVQGHYLPTNIVCHFLHLFKFARIWSPNILFQCIAVNIRFLLTLFQV